MVVENCLARLDSESVADVSCEEAAENHHLRPEENPHSDLSHVDVLEWDTGSLRLVGAVKREVLTPPDDETCEEYGQSDEDHRQRAGVEVGAVPRLVHHEGAGEGEQEDADAK